MTATVIINKGELGEKIYADVLVMLKSGVFEFKSGKAVIHRDNDGTLRKIDVEIVKYSKPRE